MTIFQSIGHGLGNAGKWFGNACKAGWNNGNIAKGAMALSAGCAGAAMTSMLIRDNGSIFGGCCHNGFGNFYGGGLGMGTMAGYDTSMNWGKYMNYTGASMYSPFGMSGMYSGMDNMFSSNYMNPFGSWFNNNYLS